MSVYINMEMPSCCGECRFLDEYGDYPNCIITDEQRGYNFRVREKRMPHCPLVPVPEHGRLIDAFDTVKTLCDKGLYMHAEIVSDMPTIIPADKEKGEQS